MMAVTSVAPRHLHALHSTNRASVDAANLRLEIAALHAERAADAEYIGPRMAFLLPYLVECGPSAHQVGLGILHRVGRMAARTPDGDAA